MLITVAFIFLVAWFTFVLGAAIHHGRVVHHAHRAAIGCAALGVLLVLPVLIVGSFGLPTGWSFRWIGVVARLAYVGSVLVALAAAGWLLFDTAFVWRERRRVFPFAYRRPPGSEA